MASFTNDMIAIQPNFLGDEEDLVSFSNTTGRFDDPAQHKPHDVFPLPQISADSHPGFQLFGDYAAGSFPDLDSNPFINWGYFSDPSPFRPHTLSAYFHAMSSNTESTDMNCGPESAVSAIDNTPQSEVQNSKSRSLKNDAMLDDLCTAVTPNQDKCISTLTSKPRRRRPSSQTYICSYIGCKDRKFSDQACLSRHLREKHGSETHHCPITTCNRHRKGFPRRLNLLAHKRRCHPNTFFHSFSDSSQKSPKENQVIDNELVASGASEVGHSEADDRLGRKLKALRDLRDELAGNLDNLDREIGILEGALAIMRDDGDG